MKLVRNTVLYTFLLLLAVAWSNSNLSIKSKEKETLNNKIQTNLKERFYTKLLTNFLLKKTNEQKQKGMDFLNTLMASSHNFLGAESENFNVNFFERTVRTQNKAEFKRYRSSLKTKIKSYKSLLRRFRYKKPQTQEKISDTKILNKRLGLDNTEEYLQFKYNDYEEIVKEINKLAKVENGKWVKVTTAQEEFGLQNPGGFCGKNKE